MRLPRRCESGPGEVFRYSDINFILLGALIEKVTGEAEDVYVQQNVFAPLGMEDTRYLPPAKACGPHTMRGAAIAWAPAPKDRVPDACAAGTWSTGLLPRIAPTARDEESRADPSKNPDLITCFGAQCTTRRRGAWVEWPGTPACSRRPTMSASLRRPCLTGSRAVRAHFRWRKRLSS